MQEASDEESCTVRATLEKIRFLVENPESGKSHHPPLKGQWRVHIGHFVLFYVIDAKENAIVFLTLLHHDEAYN